MQTSSFNTTFNLLYASKEMIESDQDLDMGLTHFKQLKDKDAFFKINQYRFSLSRNSNGFLNRLKHNNSTKKVYEKFYKKKFESKTKNLIDSFNSLNSRLKAMPRIRRRSKESLMRELKLKNSLGSKTVLEKKEKVEMAITERKKEIRPVRFAWRLHRKERISAHLSCRYGASFTLGESGNRSFGWLIGGANDQLIQGVWRYDIARDRFDAMAKGRGGSQGSQRIHHSAVFYQRKIFVFAGETIQTLENMMLRRTLNDLMVYHIGE